MPPVNINRTLFVLPNPPAGPQQAQVAGVLPATQPPTTQMLSAQSVASSIGGALQSVLSTITSALGSFVGAVIPWWVWLLALGGVGAFLYFHFH